MPEYFLEQGRVGLYLYYRACRSHSTRFNFLFFLSLILSLEWITLKFHNDSSNSLYFQSFVNRHVRLNYEKFFKPYRIVEPFVTIKKKNCRVFLSVSVSRPHPSQTNSRWWSVLDTKLLHQDVEKVEFIEKSGSSLEKKIFFRNREQDFVIFLRDVLYGYGYNTQREMGFSPTIITSVSKFEGTYFWIL